MENSSVRECEKLRIKDNVAKGISALLDEENNSLPTIVLGGHNVFNNTISNSIVIQLNANAEDLTEALEKTPDDIQKRILDAILNTLEKRYSQSKEQSD
jgi:hypothetical protein